MKTQPSLIRWIPVLFTAFAISCNQDVPKVPVCRINTMKLKSYPHFDLEQTYAYNSGKLVSIAIEVSQYGGDPEFFYEILEYDAQGNISRTIFQPGNTTEEYTYNSSNQLILIEKFDGQGNLSGYSEHQYLNGQLVKIQNYGASSSGSYMKNYAVYEYADSSSKNPKQLRRYSIDGTLIETREFEYDDQKTSIAGNGAYARLMSALGWGENNLIRETLTYANGSVSVTKSVFEFNNHGYPIKLTNTEDGNSFSYTTAGSYTYTCE